jgi:hypothetical protein
VLADTVGVRGDEEIGGIMGDKSRGIYQKFIVTRTDGKSESGEKHDGCFYFVLDVDHDKHAIPALKSYMVAALADGYVELAFDVGKIVKAAEQSEADSVVKAVEGYLVEARNNRDQHEAMSDLWKKLDVRCAEIAHVLNVMRIARV